MFNKKNKPKAKVSAVENKDTVTKPRKNTDNQQEKPTIRSKGGKR